MKFIKLHFLFFLFSLKVIVLSIPLNETAINGECDPVNKLLKKFKSYNCCLEQGITCSNGQITKM